MKTIISLAFIGLFLGSCQSKLSEIDKKLLQELETTHQYIHDRQDQEIFITYNKIAERGNRHDEIELFTKLFDYRKLYPQLKQNIEQGKQDHSLHSKYSKKVSKLKEACLAIGFKEKDFKDDSLLSFVPINHIFTQTIHKNHLLQQKGLFTKLCKQSIGASCCYFDNVYIHLNAKNYYAGDSIYGRVIANAQYNSTPLFPKIKVNGKEVNGYSKYSLVVDSLATPLNVEVSYFNRVDSDTTYNLLLNYDILK